MAISEALQALINGRRGLSEAETEAAVDSILAGQATEAQMAAFLVALHLKGESVEELTGAAQAMRRAAGTPPYRSFNEGAVVDTCGTGGDSSGTFNISTLAAFVVAGAGVRVAKHGNRSLSSACGSADLLEALGVDLTKASTTLDSVGIAFYFAPLFHRATRHVQPVRAQLRTRTIFNYLGPLTNPAGANIQVAGAFSEDAARLIAHALAALGLPRGFVVHGLDGLDEVTTTTGTIAFEVANGTVQRRTFNPDEFGMPLAIREDLIGGSIATNVEIALQVLNGVVGRHRDIVLTNAALAIFAAGRAHSLTEAVQIAARSVDSASAYHKLIELTKVSKE